MKLLSIILLVFICGCKEKAITKDYKGYTIQQELGCDGCNILYTNIYKDGKLIDSWSCGLVYDHNAVIQQQWKQAEDEIEGLKNGTYYR